MYMTEFIKTEYTNICQNIYLFDTTEKDEVHNISINYYDALSKKLTNIKESIILFNKCIENIINIKNSNLDDNKYINNLYQDILYESYVNLALIYTNNANNGNYFEVIKQYYYKASLVYTDRAEPHYYFGIYCNKTSKFDEAFISLINAKNKDFSLISDKYDTAQKSAYDFYVNEELIYTCFQLKKYDECITYIQEIINNPNFNNIKTKLDNYLTIIQDIKDNQ
jgi:hypothetical protein